MITSNTNRMTTAKNPDKRWFCALAISLISSIIFAPMVDAGCACSAVGDWEAKAAEF